ncbi:hypothetical protein EB796_005176 [Bugula neritina]|uniref:Alpha 1,4-glycosyltransferase domain-containing protein n=1 Tax=Bugula neritina TaxID=10212 RepID=A0A7J7KE99_BUGNE|nr:hypothetical protein EB796_005176 [Bugula neritina]
MLWCDYCRMVVVEREPPTTIFGKPFGWVQHGSDLARIQVLREYGGIYLDNDCLVVNEFVGLRKHHCVVSKSSEERHLGNMVLMGTPDCVFLKLYEELYKLDYQRDLWYFNGGELPQYALLDQYPGIAVMADEGVQQGMMYWLWRLDRSVEETRSKWNILHLFYGHKDYTYHDTINYNHTNIRTTHNTFARLARWIYYNHEQPFTE